MPVVLTLHAKPELPSEATLRLGVVLPTHTTVLPLATPPLNKPGDVLIEYTELTGIVYVVFVEKVTTCGVFATKGIDTNCVFDIENTVV